MVKGLMVIKLLLRLRGYLEASNKWVEEVEIGKGISRDTDLKVDRTRNDFEEILNEYIDKRVEEALDSHISGYMHSNDED